MNIVLLNASPHKNGITDAIIKYITSYNSDITIITAREISIKACIHCEYCKNNTVLTKSYTTGCCTIATEQDSALFNNLLYADILLWISPIYFYHLPADSKSIIDRSQALYYMKQDSTPLKPFFPILHAGRENGKKLFEGTLLTLMYFAQALGFTMEKPLLLRGTDKIDSLESYKESILSYCYNAQILPAHKKST